MLELYINDKKVDLEENVDIAFTYESINTQEPDAIKNSFSKTLALKGTSTNNDIFNHYYKLDRFGGNIDARKRIPFQLLNNGELVESGYLSLDSVTIKGGVINYNITLYGGLGDFFYSLAYNDNEDNSEKRISDLYFGFSDNKFGTGLDNPIPIANETDDRTLFTLDKTYLYESWERVLKGRNTDKYYGNLKNSVAMLDTVIPIPTYSGYYEDFDNNKAIIDKNSTTNPTNIDILNSGLEKVWNEETGEWETVSKPFDNRWYFAQSSRDIDEWEARDFRAGKQRLAIKNSAILEAISNPINNGGYEVEWDGGIKISPFYKDTYTMIPRITQNDMIEFGSIKQTFSLDKLIGNAQVSYTDDDKSFITYMPSVHDTEMHAVYKELASFDDLNLTKDTMLHFSFYPMIKCTNGDVLNGNKYYSNIKPNASLNCFFSLGKRGLYNYNYKMYEGSVGQSLFNVPLMVYGAIAYKFAYEAYYEDEAGHEEIVEGESDVTLFSTRDINQRYTSGEEFFNNSSVSENFPSMRRVSYVLEPTIDDVVYSNLVSHIRNSNGEGLTPNKVNLQYGDFNLEDNVLLQQGIFKSKDSVDVVLNIPVKDGYRITSVVVKGWSSYVNSGENTRYIRKSHSVAGLNSKLYVDELASDYVSKANYLILNNNEYPITEKIWDSNVNINSLFNFIEDSYTMYEQANRHLINSPISSYEVSNTDKTYLTEGKIEDYYQIININKKILFNTLPSPYRYLLDFIKLFNLRVEKDPYQKKIHVLENSNYFVDDIVDISEKIDLSKDINVKPINIDKKYIQFSINTPETYCTKLYKNKFDKEFNVLRFNTNYEHNNDTKKLFENCALTTGLPYKQTSILNNDVGDILPFLIPSTVTVVSEKEEEDRKDTVENVTYGYNSYEKLFNVTDKQFKLCCFDNDNKEVNSLTDTLLFFNFGVPSRTNTIASDPIDAMFLHNENECYLQLEESNIKETFVWLHRGIQYNEFFTCENNKLVRKNFSNFTNEDRVVKEYNPNDRSKFRIKFPHYGLSVIVDYFNNIHLLEDILLDENDGWFHFDNYGYLRYDNMYVKYDAKDSIVLINQPEDKTQVIIYDDYDISFSKWNRNALAESIPAYPIFLPYLNSKDVDNTVSYTFISQTYFKTIDEEYIGIPIRIGYIKDTDIFNGRWKSEFDVLYNKDSITVDAYVLLQGNPQDLLKKRFYFNNCLWRLIKVDNYSIIQQKPSKCTFIRL